jgi:putative addiction module component (TIGR02574 family)
MPACSSPVDEISPLSVDERLGLIGQLGDCLEQEPLPLSSAQQKELDRRLASLDHERADGQSQEQLRAELERNAARISGTISDRL